MMYAQELAGSGVWYLATPYSKWPAGADDAAKQAAIVTTKLQNAGMVVYSPIVHSHQLCVVDRATDAPSLDHLSYEYWLAIDYVHIASSCGLVVVDMEGWRDSFGVKQEIYCYKQDFKAKPRYLLDPIDLWLKPLEIIK